MKTYVRNDREWVTVRQVRCSACGYKSQHVLARWDPTVTLLDTNEDRIMLFLIPYAGLNGGVGREVDAEVWQDVMPRKERDVFLSLCCDAPHRSSWSRRRVKQRDSSRLDS